MQFDIQLLCYHGILIIVYRMASYACMQVWYLFPVVFLLLFVHHAGGQDDAGADLDMESMMGDTGPDIKDGDGKEAAGPVLTQIEQTTRALQELGVILCKLLS